MRGAKAAISGVPFFSHTSILFVWSRVGSQPSTSTVGPDIPGIILL